MGNYHLSFYSSSAAVSNGELQHLQEQLIDTIKETATALLDGLVKVWPVADAKRNICEYCDYRSMCGLDRSMLPEREKSEAMRKEIKEDE